METFRIKVEQSMEQVQRLRQHKTGLLEERFQAAAKERLAISKKEQAEAQQMAAVEAEDFDLADRMNTLLDQVEAERLEQVRILEHIGRALQQLQDQKQSLVSGVTACFVEIQDSLVVFLKQQQESSKDTTHSAAATSHEDIAKKFEQISKQIAAEEERLQQDWKHLERDTGLVKAERQELEDAISEQAGEFERLRDAARDRVKVVEQEMEDLRQLLAAKQREVASLRTEAAGHDEAVLKVRVKFSRQLGRVQHKEMTLEDNREEWETEQAALKQQKEAHELQVTQHEQELVERESLLALLHKEVEMAETFQAIVAKEIGFDVLGEDKPTNGAQPQTQEDNDSSPDNGKLVDCEAAVIEAKEVVQATESSLHDLEREQVQLQDKLPQLEELKKAAAAKRDFRSAGKFSKEIKESQSRLHELQTNELVHAQERLEGAQTELQQREAELAQEQAKAAERERQVAMTNMQRLAQHMARLHATQSTVCGTDDYDEEPKTSIQSVGAHVLYAQMEALRLEGETYGEKYGGWDTLLEEAGLTAKNKSTNHETQNNGAAEASKQQEEPSPQPSKPTDPKILQRFRELTAKVEETNAATEAAAAEEDYEMAAKLDETMQELLQEIQSLGLTDDEMAAALAEEAEESKLMSDDQESAQPTTPKDESSPTVETEQACTNDIDENVQVPSEEPEGTGENTSSPADIDVAQEEDNEQEQQDNDAIHTNGTAVEDGETERNKDEKKEAGHEDDVPEPVKGREQQVEEAHSVTTTKNEESATTS